MPADQVHDGGQHLDVPGAGLVTLSLMIAVYGVVGGNEAGWTSFKTLGLLAAAAVLMVAFVVREARVEHPLVPLRLFKLRNVAISQILGVLFRRDVRLVLPVGTVPPAGARVRRPPGRLGLPARLPGDGVLLAARLRPAGNTDRHPVPLATGLGLVAVSLALFAFAPVGGEYVVHVLPAMVLLGLGAGIAFNPVLLAAMGDVEPHEAGLASGVVNASFMMGGALGLAILVAVSSWWTGGQPDPTSLESLHGGLQVAFAVGAIFAAAAAAIGGGYLRPKPTVVLDAEASAEVAVPVH